MIKEKIKKKTKKKINGKCNEKDGKDGNDKNEMKIDHVNDDTSCDHISENANVANTCKHIINA